MTFCGPSFAFLKRKNPKVMQYLLVPLSSVELPKREKEKDGKKEALPLNLFKSGKVGSQVAFFR